ncbi:MAG TPA: Rho termination factor N-terminal domain-containing protein [Thermoleophilaceae bacterium]|nr:Rho termination factor N-terminal domain-containing protein [Thermoleophilaceae bacterium]
MSVLQRKDLEDSPLADLHAIASELGIEGYRALRKGDLIAAILGIQGGDEGEPADEGGRDAAVERRGEIEDAPEPERPADAVGDEPEGAAEQPDGEFDDEPKLRGRRAARPEPAATEDEEERETVTGVLDVLSNGSGFVRVEGSEDVYVSPAQIRRCELRPGDEVSGPARPARRNERYPSLVRVATVNGKDAEPPEQRPHFAELTPVHASERLSGPPALAAVPFGKGSRVAIAGAAGAGATRLLRELVTTLAGQPGDLTVTVVLAGARPEEVTDWRRETEAPVYGGSFDSSPADQAQAAQLAVERAKRVAERGGDAIVVIDSLDALEAGLARRLFGAGRKLEEGGSLTVVAAVGAGSEHLRVASTRVVLETGTAEPTVSVELSGVQRADMLA